MCRLTDAENGRDPMAEINYYNWLLDCANDIVPGVEPAIQERDPSGGFTAMDRLYNSLYMSEKTKFVEAMKEVAGAGDNVPSQAKILVIDFAWLNGIWDIESEVRELDKQLPQDPWDYDKLNPPSLEERDRINLRGVINKFLIICNRDKKVA